MSNSRLAALVLVAALGALALPGAAFGAAFTALKPCYVSLPSDNPRTELINLSGTGFTPNARVDVAVDGAPAVSGAPVDAAGNLAADPAAPLVVPSPFVAERDREIQIVATEQGAAAPAISQATRVTALNVGIQPRRARPSSRVLFRGRGFTGGGKVYAHYRYKGRTRKTVTFAPTGPCGRFTARKRQIPVSHPGTGQWTVQFDQQRRYSRLPSSVFVRLSILVTRTLRAGPSAATSTVGATAPGR